MIEPMTFFYISLAQTFYIFSGTDLFYIFSLEQTFSIFFLALLLDTVIRHYIYSALQALTLYWDRTTCTLET